VPHPFPRKRSGEYNGREHGQNEHAQLVTKGDEFARQTFKPQIFWHALHGRERELFQQIKECAPRLKRRQQQQQ